MEPHLNDVLLKLHECGRLEGSELGEYWTQLVEFAGHRNHEMSTTLAKEVEKEVRDCLKYAKDNYRIVEREYTQTIKERVLEEKE